MLTVPQRSKVQSLLKEAKTNISLKGRSFRDGEETWHLFANWLFIAKSLRLPPHVTTIVEDMGKLLTAIYQWTYDPFVQGCGQIAVPINDRSTCFGSATRGPWYWVICNLWGGACFVATLLSRLTMSFKTTF